MAIRARTTSEVEKAKNSSQTFRCNRKPSSGTLVTFATKFEHVKHFDFDGGVLLDFGLLGCATVVSSVSSMGSKANMEKCFRVLVPIFANDGDCKTVPLSRTVKRLLEGAKLAVAKFLRNAPKSVCVRLIKEYEGQRIPVYTAGIGTKPNRNTVCRRSLSWFKK